MNFCPKCGNQIKPNARFCGSCGSSIDLVIPDQTVGFNQPQFHTSHQEFRMRNSQQRVVNTWIILFLVFVFCIFLPSIIGLDGFEGGFAMSFIAGFMAIMSIVIIFIYRSRARYLAKILSGEGRIAVWQYSQDEWLRFIEADFKEEKKSKKVLFLIVAAISVVVGIILMISVQDVLALLIALGIIPIVAIPAFWAPRYRFNKLKNSEPKALIAEKGVVVGKMFHLWVSLGASLDQVVINMDETPHIIEFTYSMPTRTGRQVEVARIPIPKGYMDEAKRVVEYFNANE